MTLPHEKTEKKSMYLDPCSAQVPIMVIQSSLLPTFQTKNCTINSGFGQDGLLMAPNSSFDWRRDTPLGLSWQGAD